MADQKKLSEKEIKVLLPHPDKQIPKFANSMSVSKVDDSNLILSFTYGEPEPSPTIVIDRVIVTKKHAKEIIKVLERTLDDNDE